MDQDGGSVPLEKYKTYESKVILDNYEMFLQHTDLVYNKITSELNTSETTWTYNKYNVFSFSSTSHLYYDFYKELSNVLRDYIGKDLRIWMEAWLNYHKYEDLKSLSWHAHEYLFHGYVCIDPKNTVTQFKGFEIQNKPGQIYIGLGQAGMEHNVKAFEPYEGYRSTLAFDCVLDANRAVHNNSFFPLL